MLAALRVSKSSCVQDSSSSLLDSPLSSPDNRSQLLLSLPLLLPGLLLLTGSGRDVTPLLASFLLELA